MSDINTSQNYKDDELSIFEGLPAGEEEVSPAGIPRREFLKQTTLAGGALVAAQVLGDQALAHGVEEVPDLPVPANLENVVNVTVKINGAPRSLAVDSRMTLLDALRERLDLTGSKKGCDHGQCGACTVIVDGQRVLSCLTLVASCQNKVVTSIEGISRGDELHPIQTAFLKHDGYQCGYCTPGQICSAVALLSEAKKGDLSYVSNNVSRAPAPLQLSDEEIRERMSGNICRCGAYPNIVNAIKEVHSGKTIQQQWQFTADTKTPTYVNGD